MALMDKNWHFFLTSSGDTVRIFCRFQSDLLNFDDKKVRNLVIGNGSNSDSRFKISKFSVKSQRAFFFTFACFLFQVIQYGFFVAPDPAGPPQPNPRKFWKVRMTSYCAPRIFQPPILSQVLRKLTQSEYTQCGQIF